MRVGKHSDWGHLGHQCRPEAADRPGEYSDEFSEAFWRLENDWKDFVDEFRMLAIA